MFSQKKYIFAIILINDALMKGVKTLKSTFGSRLRSLREDSNLTQTQLANIFKVTPPSISQYENDVRSPDYGLLVKIADYFNVSVDYLLGRTDFKNINRGNMLFEKIDVNSKDFTLAAHRTNGNQSDIKDIEGLKDLIRQIISEEKDK